MFAVNARAPFFLIQEAAKVMRREGGGGGTIVNTRQLGRAHDQRHPRLAAQQELQEVQERERQASATAEQQRALNRFCCVG